MKRFRYVSLTLTLLLCFTLFSNWAYFADTGMIEHPLLEFIVFVLAAAFVVSNLVYWFNKSALKSNKAHLSALMIWLLCMLGMLVPELVVYATGKYSLGFGESGDEEYYSPNHVPHSGWRQTYTPNKIYDWVTSEFKSLFWVNSLGYKDEEWCKDYDGVRVVSLGDSFTEGVGAETPWIKELELSLEEKGIIVKTMNAGIASSDIVYDRYKLQQDLLQYQPDIVFVCINNTDISNVMGRGCTERFIEENGFKYVQFKGGPWWEYLYGTSHLIRAIIGFFEVSIDGYGRKELEEAYLCFDDQLQAFKEMSEDNGFELVVIFHPLNTDVLRKDYGVLEKVVESSRERGITTVDLLPYYLEEVEMDSSNTEYYYWPIDRHQKSYKVFADGVLHQLGNAFFTDEDTSTIVP